MPSRVSNLSRLASRQLPSDLLCLITAKGLGHLTSQNCLRQLDHSSDSPNPQISDSERAERTANRRRRSHGHHDGTFCSAVHPIRAALPVQQQPSASEKPLPAAHEVTRGRRRTAQRYASECHEPDSRFCNPLGRMTCVVQLLPGRKHCHTLCTIYLYLSRGLALFSACCTAQRRARRVPSSARHPGSRREAPPKTANPLFISCCMRSVHPSSLRRVAMQGRGRWR